ncbi:MULTISPECIES: FAD-dependent oxidoreductase [Micromonospora]|uniref:Kynurenine 3-monooxygenase n=1 Tax=Micromonospora maris TaxID=1003110 RepID=A0A9X0I379_9ACTN|nr:MULTISPECIES: NAD(P)/FAD-dependent oxidoreductase [Micromonospora]AEB46824.1 kynurenine 3-monooxygenase [Micromonospora maris AB-18-032]KUJ45995.1 kynurenine 3-monooxygenase [Micromonospora maris]RUL89930.1 FAD-dependent monooxygenase [Verrucosispora sp. FIM060022]
MNTRQDEIAVVGAGLAGCLLACYLARRGHSVTLYERRPDPRVGTPERGRSINLALSERGLDALRRIGLDEQVMADALPMRGRMVHPVVGEPDFQSYSAEGDRAINSISRGALNNALLDAAAKLPQVRVAFDHRLVGLDPATAQMTFETPQGTVTANATVVLGADGAGSAVRGQLLEHGLLTESVDFLDYGYKELTIPPLGGDFALDPGALHIWPRGTSMMIALPNPDRSFTCTLFWPNHGTASFSSLGSKAAIERYFAQHYPDLPPLAPNLVDDYQHNPVGVLGTVRCDPWQFDGRVGLLGDAAHAIVPFYGQGANCAFEDVVELDTCLDECGDDWAAALPLYQQRRQDNAEAIAQMALANFVEMRDKVASPVYQTRKKVEHALERALPGRYVSQYELVSFTTVPYAQVRRRVRRQYQVLGAVAAGAAAVLAGAVLALGRRRRG